MKVVIAGSRSIDIYKAVVDAVARSGYDITCVGCGEAIGIDKFGRRWANAMGIPVEPFPATGEWPAAGHIRNRRMAEWCDAAVLIWDGKSTGTINMLENMRRLKKPYYLDLEWSGIKTLEELFG